MSVTADCFLSFAEWTFSERQDEIGCRNAASRAYYAAYHACSIFAHQHLAVPADAPGVHVQVIEAFVGSRQQEHRAIGYMLKQCRDLRAAADYDLNLCFESREAHQALSQARKVLDKLRA